MFGIAYRRALEYLCEHTVSPSLRHSPERAKDALDDAEIGDALTQGLRAVPFEQRPALLLTYQMGFGPEEIAAIVGVSAATVKARILCARAKLCCLFSDKGHSNLSGRCDNLSFPPSLDLPS
jgi:RNA polymerase sigma factor (sigma-70 family)